MAGLIGWLCLCFLVTLTVHLLIYLHAPAFFEQEAVRGGIDWDDAGVSCELPGQGAHYPWSRIGKWFEDAHLFVLFVSEDGYLTLFKSRFQDAAALEMFRSKLRPELKVETFET